MQVHVIVRPIDGKWIAEGVELAHEADGLTMGAAMGKFVATLEDRVRENRRAGKGLIGLWRSAPLGGLDACSIISYATVRALEPDVKGSPGNVVFMGAGT